jgi:hypothetical protein
MNTFLSFIGILAIVLFLKFLYDTYVKGERYSPNGEPLPSDYEIESFKVWQEFEKEKRRLEYFEKLNKHDYSINELRNLQKKWSEKKFHEATEENIQIKETYAFYCEIWTKEYIEHVEKENSDDDLLNEYSKSEFENAFNFSIKNRNYSEAIVFIIVYNSSFPEEAERLERCNKELYLLKDGENPPENLYYFKDEGIIKVDFK